MIPQQLDLFGLPPRPPKKILRDDFVAPPTESAKAAKPMAVLDIPETAAAVELSEPSSPTHASELEMPEAEVPVIEENDTQSHVTAPSTSMEGENLLEEKDGNLAEIVELNTDTSVAVVMPEKEATRRLPQEIVVSSRLQIPPDETLFQRQYYSMRETAAMFDLPQPLLRHWENEFDVVQPKKNKKGDRHFRPVDIKTLELIYHLLKVKKFTIEGAKEYLRHRNKALDTFELTQRLEKLKLFLLELKAHL